MLHGKINTGKRLAALALCGLFALQAPAVPAMAAETLTVQDQGFYHFQIPEPGRSHRLGCHEGGWRDLCHDPCRILK